MIEHLKIFITVLSILVGVAVVAAINQYRKRYPYAFLLPLLYYMVFYVLLFSGLFISKYFEINLATGMNLANRKLLENIGTLLLTLIELGLLLTMLGIARQFFEKQIPVLVSRGTIIFAAIIILSYLLKMGFGNYVKFYQMLNRLHSILWNNLIVLEIPMLLGLLVINRFTRDKERRRLVQMFGYLFLARYLLVAIALFWVVQQETSDSVQLLFTVGFFLCFSLIPLIWLRYFFRTYADSLIQYVETRSGLEELIERYNISSREQEILRLIAGGKTNREIADQLFIAIPTVKNHIYNLYQKLNVKSRYQLLVLLSNYQPNTH
jgi:DNA-binding CsgD family transcriptional regulator